MPITVTTNSSIRQWLVAASVSLSLGGAALAAPPLQQHVPPPPHPNLRLGSGPHVPYSDIVTKEAYCALDEPSSSVTLRRVGPYGTPGKDDFVAARVVATSIKYKSVLLSESALVELNTALKPFSYPSMITFWCYPDEAIIEVRGSGPSLDSPAVDQLTLTARLRPAGVFLPKVERRPLPAHPLD